MAIKKNKWETNFRKIEIELFTGCNLQCPSCDRSAPQAPSKEYMTLDQIKHFVDESIVLQWKWERIVLLGGEPTLHPMFDNIFPILDRYRKFNQDTHFRIVTNGYGPVVEQRLRLVPSWIEVFNTQKTKEPPLFSAYNMAPIDYSHSTADEDYSHGCAITQLCGLGLTRYGYYPCGAGASIDRVFGFDIGIKKLADVTRERVLDQLQKLCCLCGHYNDFDPIVEFLEERKKLAASGASKNEFDELQSKMLPDWTKSGQISPTWVDAYERYGQKSPLMSLY